MLSGLLTLNAQRATQQTDGDSTLQQEHLPQTTVPVQQYSLPIRAPLGGITIAFIAHRLLNY